MLDKFKNDHYFNNIHYFNNNKNILSELCVKHGSDKGCLDFNKTTLWKWSAHTYSNFYYSLFNHCRENIKLVFECGIGTNNPDVRSNMTINGQPGASLKVWKDYFPNAKIYGADIDKNILFNEDRISTYFVDQLNKETIEKMWQDIKMEDFDIIIDDGLHNAEANINLFLNSFHKLRKDGVYIIEDVHFKNIDIIQNKLSEYNPEVIILSRKDHNYRDNNLILFRKN
jgi:hypothetical protein